MAKHDDDESKLNEQVAKAKPGFVRVRKVRKEERSTAAPPNAGTPDTSELREKSAALREQQPNSDLANSTDDLLKKFLPDSAVDSGNEVRPRAHNPQKAAPDVKGAPRIVSVRPTRGADSDEGVPPKDLQMVMDDEGQIGESS